MNSRAAPLALLPFLLAAFLFLSGCDLSDQSDANEPRFQPGEYGGDALSGTEDLSNLVPSPDGKRLLVSVSAKACQQSFERGIYTINTETGKVEGPLVEVMVDGFLARL